MRYRDYLKSDAWKKSRAAARQRAGNRCEMCGGSPDHVHHVKYPKNYSNDSLDNLIVLCELCHSKSHGIRRNRVVATDLSVQKFAFDGNEYAIKCIDANGNQWMRLEDVISAACESRDEYQRAKLDTNKIEYKLDDDEYIQLEFNGKLEYWVTKHGAYGVAMLMYSRKAKAFKRYLKHDLLPAAEKGLALSGNPGKDQAMMIQQQAGMIVDLYDKQDAMQKQIDGAIQALDTLTGGDFYSTVRLRFLKHKIKPTADKTKQVGGECRKRALSRGMEIPPKVQEGTYFVGQWPNELIDEVMLDFGLLH